MILKIYIATVIATFVSDALSSLRTRNLMKKCGYKRKRITVLEALSKVMGSLIIYALPVINVLLSLIVLTMSDEVRMRIYEEVGYYYKAGDNE